MTPTLQLLESLSLVNQSPRNLKVNTTAGNYNSHQVVLYLIGNGSSKMEREKELKILDSRMEVGLGSERVNVSRFIIFFQICVDLGENLLY